MHSLSVSVCSCLSETLCAHTICMGICSCSNYFDMLSCPGLQLKTASSSSWGGSPTSFLKSFLALVREKATKDLRTLHKSPFVVVLNITLCSLDVNISAVRTTPSDKGEERR